MSFDKATRAGLIAAGLKLFHAGSIADVMVDDIVREAGVTKKVFYRHYCRKQDFILDCYQVFGKQVLAIYQNLFQTHTGVEARLGAVFKFIEVVGVSCGVMGCGFMRAVASVGEDDDHPLRIVVSEHKKRVEQGFTQMLLQEGFAEPQQLARTLAIIVDGVLAQTMLHRELGYLDDAAKLTRIVLDQARKVSSADQANGAQPGAALSA